MADCRWPFFVDLVNGWWVKCVPEECNNHFINCHPVNTDFWVLIFHGFLVPWQPIVFSNWRVVKTRYDYFSTLSDISMLLSVIYVDSLGGMKHYLPHSHMLVVGQCELRDSLCWRMGIVLTTKNFHNNNTQSKVLPDAGNVLMMNIPQHLSRGSVCVSPWTSVIQRTTWYNTSHTWFLVPFLSWQAKCLLVYSIVLLQVCVQGGTHQFGRTEMCPHLTYVQLPYGVQNSLGWKNMLTFVP